MGMGDDARRQMGRTHSFVVNGAPELLTFVRELLQDEGYNVATTSTSCSGPSRS